MSCNEWERGTIKLPAAAFAAVRKAVADADLATKKAAFDRAQAFWKSLPAKAKRATDAYEAAVREYLWTDAPGYSPGYGPRRLKCGLSHADADALFSMLHIGTREPAAPNRWGARLAKPRRVLRSDVEWPTNRTMHFSLGEASITFDRSRSTVTWDVPENNHACDSAHDQPLAKVFFRALDAVKWTRGSGGDIIGNNEYNRDAGREYEGGGGSYLVASYGPKTKSTARRF